MAVNVAERADLIYDFYGFPPHYYEVEYPNRGSREVAESVIERLSNAGIGVERVQRGLDHGVWVGFLAGMSYVLSPSFPYFGNLVCVLRESPIADVLIRTNEQTAFDPKKNPLNVPIVQVSLLGNEDPDQHYHLGRALERLRDDGVLIIGAGMAVHNLDDFREARPKIKLMP